MPPEATEAHFPPLLDALPAPVLVLGSSGRVLYANARAAALFGVAAAPVLIGRDVDRLFCGTGLARLTGALKNVASGGEACGAIESEICSEGHGRRQVVVDLGAAEFPPAGILAVLQDVTESRAGETRFTLSQSFANIGTWDWNIETGELFWSDRIAPLFGYAPGQVDTTYESFLQAVHPEDRDRVTGAVEACLGGAAEYDIEHRVVWPDGTVHWMSERGDVVRNDAGEAVRMLGVVQDITERKRAAAELELAAAVIRNTPEGVLITDAGMNILSVNPAFSRTTGYTQSEVVGRQPSLLASGRHGPAFYREMWRALESEGQWQGEIWNRRKDGDIYPEWLNISAIRNELGEVTHYAAVFSDLSTQEHVRQRLHNLAYYDVLTQLPNRELFRDRLTNDMARARRDGGSIALLFIDLDRFKTVNDSLGHSAGDALLQAVAQRLQCAVRETDTVARLGGDEFTIILTDVKHPEDAAHVAAAIIDAFKESFPVEGHELYITPSIGISLYPADGSDEETLIRNADAAMYRAKEVGRNNYQFYTEEMSSRSAERLVLENELRKSIERGELSLVYQPQVALSSGRMVGVEVLARWENRHLGRVRPDIFIGVAEDTGFIVELGRWVMHESLRQLHAWRTAGYRDLRMAVNVSGHQMVNDDFLRELAGWLEQFGIPPRQLEIELTESVLMENTDVTAGLFAELQAIGVGLAVDDFGTGYSSLAYLKRFAVDKLKIDRSFVMDIPLDANDSEIAATVIAMGHRLGLRVVAEGVETREQLAFLQEQGCDEIQGYLFSPPVGAEEITRMLEEERRIEVPLPV